MMGRRGGGVIPAARIRGRGWPPPAFAFAGFFVVFSKDEFSLCGSNRLESMLQIDPIISDPDPDPGLLVNQNPDTSLW